MSGIQVGTYEVRTAEEWEIHYETASWFKRVRVEPGVYPVYAHPTESGIGHALYVRAEGICTASYFESRILQHRSGHTDEHKGEVTPVGKMLATYDRADAWDSSPLRLTDPRVGFREWTHTPKVYDYSNRTHRWGAPELMRSLTWNACAVAA
jgi:hypothetical protein